MTEREALKLALDALKHTHPSALTSFYTIGDRDKAIKAIQEHLAQPEQDWSMLEAMQGSLREHMARIKELESQLAQPEQEPIAWLSKGGKGIWFHEPDASMNATPLYTTTLQRKPLTDEEVNKLVDDEDWYNDPHGFARAIEATLRSKNT